MKMIAKLSILLFFAGCAQDPQPRKSFPGVPDSQEIFSSKIYPGGRPNAYKSSYLEVKMEGTYDLDVAGLAYFEIDSTATTLQRDLGYEKKSLALFITSQETSAFSSCLSAQGMEASDCYFRSLFGDDINPTTGLAGTPAICVQANCSYQNGAGTCDIERFARILGSGVFANKWNRFDLGTIRDKAYLEVPGFLGSRGQSYSDVVLIPDLDAFCNNQFCGDAQENLPRGSCYFVGKFPRFSSAP